MVSTVRLYVLRATYLMTFLFVTTTFWPMVVQQASHPGEVDIMHSVARCFFAALAPLCLLGLRYPLDMLPVILFELFWKTLWLASVGLPFWLAHRVTPEVYESIKACGLGLVLFPAVIPWPYVVARYVTRRGERWRWSASTAAVSTGMPTTATR